MIHFDGGCTPLHDVRTFRPSNVSTCFRAIPFVLIFLRTLLHASKSQPLCFQAIPNSLRKTTGWWGGCLLLTSLPATQRTKCPGGIAVSASVNGARPDRVAVLILFPSFNLRSQVTG